MIGYSKSNHLGAQGTFKVHPELAASPPLLLSTDDSSWAPSLLCRIYFGTPLLRLTLNTEAKCNMPNGMLFVKLAASSSPFFTHGSSWSRFRMSDLFQDAIVSAKTKTRCNLPDGFGVVKLGVLLLSYTHYTSSHFFLMCRIYFRTPSSLLKQKAGATCQTASASWSWRFLTWSPSFRILTTLTDTSFWCVWSFSGRHRVCQDGGQVQSSQRNWDRKADVFFVVFLILSLH